MNIPNLLSIFRIVLVPVFACVFFSGSRDAHLHAAFVYGLAALTDVLDGVIARRCNMTTKLGKILDPLADKLMTFAALLCISIAGIIPGWAAAIFFIKEALMGVGALLMYKRLEDVMYSNYLGKGATIAFFAVCAILMLFNDIPQGTATAMISLALCLAGAAFVNYLTQFIKILKKWKKSDNEENNERQVK